MDLHRGEISTTQTIVRRYPSVLYFLRTCFKMCFCQDLEEMIYFFMARKKIERKSSFGELEIFSQTKKCIGWGVKNILVFHKALPTKTLRRLERETMCFS